jgi:hypothetical protein
MTASTPEEIEAYRLLALRAGLKLESVGMKMSKGRSAFSIVKKMTGLPGRSAKELLPLYEDLLRQYGILSLKKTMTNPVKPRKGESERKFVSRCMSEEKRSFPKQKQRIAVCLSKARKNPLLESGATITGKEKINRQAAKMG